MKVAVLGASGIVGQTMIMREPEWAEAEYVRKEEGFGLYKQVDLSDNYAVDKYLNTYKPDVVINLAGINQVDVVEANPELSWPINVDLPERLAKWSDRHGRLIQVSTQAVFDGYAPPYGPLDPPSPVNKYGEQKAAAEAHVKLGLNWLIARLTLVLGRRPFPAIGRMNPLEHMLASPEQRQVRDRHMSVVSAIDAADALWYLCRVPDNKRIYHIGSAEAYSRYDIAKSVANYTSNIVEPCSQDEFPGAAPRAKNTRWKVGSLKSKTLEEIVVETMEIYESGGDVALQRRAMEIALFLENHTFDEAKARLELGFHENHAMVAQDFTQYGANVNDDDSLLDWYLDTEAYIWELSAYHLDPGFNYEGMCQGIVNHLKTRDKYRVLCMGDGIGDLSMKAAEAGLTPIYHDLEGSRTAEFAQFRFNMNQPVSVHLTESFVPALPSMLDAVVALDYFEHLPNVEEWARAVFISLNRGGLFMAQNAFAIGDAEHGNSIPMHLSVNNKYAKEWDQLLLDIGFERTGEGTWWRKP